MDMNEMDMNENESSECVLYAKYYHLKPGNWCKNVTTDCTQCYECRQMRYIVAERARRITFAEKAEAEEQVNWRKFLRGLINN